jgi:hypothetical protein
MKHSTLKKSLTTIAVCAGLCGATPFGFEAITGNSPVDPGIGEAQLALDVSESGGFALFTFSNSGPEASAICDIYFDDDDGNLSFDHFAGSGGVAFSVGAAPPILPGGEGIFTTDHAYDSDAPVSQNGINPGEWLTMYFNLPADYSFAQLTTDLTSGAVRVGLHVQDFADGESESFVTRVPEPSALSLLGLGIIGMAVVLRRKKR